MLKFSGLVNMPTVGINGLEKELSYFSKFVNSVEIIFDYPIGLHMLSGNDVKRLKDLLNSFDLDVLIHAPFAYNAPLSNSLRLFDESMKKFRLTSGLGSTLNARFITTHLGVATTYQKNMHDLIDRAVWQLEKIAREYDVMIGIENMKIKPDSKPGLRRSFPLSIEEMMRIKNSELFITLDVGHALLTDTNILDFIDEFGKRIRNMHIHDCDGKTDHLCIGSGKIAFDPIFEKLRQMNYRGYLTIEVFERHDFEKSFEQLNKYGHC